MFHFTTLAIRHYGLMADTFGHPGIIACLSTPPGISQTSTPFIASGYQDIPHTPLVAWPHLSKALESRKRGPTTALRRCPRPGSPARLNADKCCYLFPGRPAKVGLGVTFS